MGWTVVRVSGAAFLEGSGGVRGRVWVDGCVVLGRC